jgi:hypothetical protein
MLIEEGIQANPIKSNHLILHIDLHILQTESFIVTLLSTTSVRFLAAIS